LPPLLLFALIVENTRLTWPQPWPSKTIKESLVGWPDGTPYELLSEIDKTHAALAWFNVIMRDWRNAAPMVCITPLRRPALASRCMIIIDQSHQELSRIFALLYSVPAGP
jgi:hypothetical protein